MKGKINLVLTEDEEAEIKVIRASVETRKSNESITLVGTLLTPWPFNAYALKATMKGAWKLKNGFVFSELRHSLFIFKFITEEDKAKVIKGGPWSFDKALLALKDPGLEQPSQIMFDRVPFWIRIYDIPLGAMTTETAEAIGKVFGGIEEVDEDDLIICPQFLRIRVQINILKPLRRGMILVVEGKRIWVELKYERLPNFCYTCGCTGHTEMDCGKEVDPND